MGWSRRWERLKTECWRKRIPESRNEGGEAVVRHLGCDSRWMITMLNGQVDS
jgi:hypothetical protein